MRKPLASKYDLSQRSRNLYVYVLSHRLRGLMTDMRSVICCHLHEYFHTVHYDVCCRGDRNGARQYIRICHKRSVQQYADNCRFSSSSFSNLDSNFWRQRQRVDRGRCRGVGHCNRSHCTRGMALLLPKETKDDGKREHGNCYASLSHLQRKLWNSEP